MGKKLKLKTDPECVRVVTRCRPLSKTEIEDKRDVIVMIDPKAGTVQLKTPDGGLTRVFTYDFAFDENCTQREVYDKVAYPIVQAAIDGFNGTVFAYGQTGTGKSFSMVGVYEQVDLRGIIPNAFVHIFEELATNDNPNKEYLVRASYLEIYNEEVRDLLSKNYTQKLDLKENPDTGVYVKGLSAFVVKSFKEIDDVMTAGNKNRQVGATKMNAESSRSHSIFSITIESSEKRDTDEPYVKVGKLNLVDLAGSERQSKTGAEGSRLTEAVNINLSLSALGNVISCLTDPKAKHIPYRDSKLTRLLQDSLGGNSKTVMIATMGPADWNFDETMSTLRYANRAKNIKNKPKINEDPKDAMIRQFQEEIERLKGQLGDGTGGVIKKKKRRKGGTKKPRVKKTKKGDDGEEIEYSASASSDEGDYTDEEDLEDLSKDQMTALEKQMLEEKSKLEGDMKMEKAEKKRLMEEMQRREQTLEEERKKRDAMAAKLKAMEEKIVVGGENMIDVAEKQARELEQKQREREQKEREEKQLQEQLREQEEDLKLKNSHFKDIQEEIEIKTNKLKKLWNKLEVARQEFQDLEEEQRRDKEDLLGEIRAQSRDLRLCMLVINHFIPETEMGKIRSRAVWDEASDTYRVRHQAYTGNNIDRMKQSQEGEQDQERFNADAINYLENAADDYIPSAQEEVDDDNEFGIPNVYFSYAPPGSRQASRQTSSRDTRKRSSSRPSGKSKAKAKHKSKSKRKATKAIKEEEFPEARGLVKSGRH